MSTPRLPEPAAPASTLDGVVNTLLDGLDGFTFADGRTLTANTLYPIESPIPEARLPYLGLFGCEAQVTQYLPDVDRVMVNATLFVKVRGHREQQGESTARAYFDGILVAFDRIRGLPVDADGKIAPRSLDPVFDDAPAAYLVDVDGPRITRAVVNEQTGSPYATITISASMQYDQDREALTRYYAQKAVVRAPVADAAHAQVAPKWPAVQPSSADTFAAGFHDTEAPDAGGAVRVDPPFPDGQATPPFVYGAAPDDVVVRVDVLGAGAVTAPATIQLQAVAVTAAGTTYTVTDAATWETSDAGFATVASGLVTGVAAGTATITATWLGVTGRKAITVT